MSVTACAALVEKGDPLRFAATMAADPAARVRLWPLYALNLELARAPWASSQPMIAEMRLQWWADTLDRAAAGERSPQHEVAGPLADLIRDTALPVGPLKAIAEARRWDCWEDPFADAAALAGYLDATAGGLMWSAARALGAPEGAEAAVRGVAFAAGLANWFLAVPDLTARGRAPLPDPSEAAVAALACMGLDRLAQARALQAGAMQVGRVPRAALPALLPAWQAEGLLKQAAAQPGRVAQGGLGLSEFARRGRLLWVALTGRW